MATEQPDEHNLTPKCDICKNLVSFSCRRCRVNLCDTCVPAHLREKAVSGHDMVEYGTKDEDDECICELHSPNGCTAYCKKCDIPICKLCISDKHSTHEKCPLFEQIVKLLKKIEQENGRLQLFKTELEKVLDHTKTILSSLTIFFTQRKDDITARGEEWRKYVKKTVQKLHRELNSMQNEHEGTLQKQKKELEEVIKNVDEINKQVAKLQKSKNLKELQNFVPIIEKQELLRNFSLDQYPLPIFYACKIDENYLQTFFGHIEKEKKERFTIFARKQEETDLWDPQMHVLEMPTLSSVIDSEFPINDENENRLYDLAITDDNKVWMGGHSKELKLFDLQGNLHRTVRITCLGLFLCVHNNNVVYSDNADKSVKMKSDSNAVETMFKTKEWNPNGLTSTGSGDLLVCLERDSYSKVVRYSSTGTVLQSIQYDSYGERLYKSPKYIAENVNGDVIVTDWKKNAVIAVNRLGIYRYSFSWKEGKSFVCSVATDLVGHVLVTDFYATNIRILDRDGRFLRYIVLEDDIRNARGLCTFGHGEVIVAENITGIAKRIKYLEH
ncbi:tripartite motif-containing protein 2-like [Magallana gigas]|uniref:tripartite motif-containing protein 2-like n=1 Tax=Magallana gigas TaxID=29159 RepID=UPI00333F413A